MYHIKNDKRALDSALTIYRSIRHLCKKKNLADVSITDIKEECGVSRSTFYRNFDNISDVLEWKLDSFFKEFLEKKSGDSITYFFTYWNDHSDLIYLLTKQNEDIIKTVMKNNLSRKDNVLDEYLLELKVSIMTSLLCKWVYRGKKESIQDMVSITEKLFSVKYTKLLTEF